MAVFLLVAMVVLSRQAAAILQNTLNQGLCIDAPRQEKANDSYYI